MNAMLHRTRGILVGALRPVAWVGGQLAGLFGGGRDGGDEGDERGGGGEGAGTSVAKSGMDDVTLARKVESEIFRATRIPKGTVDVNAVDGVVYLRGEVKRPEHIRRLEARTRAIPEVRDVENLLHLPKTPAPTRADTPRRQQRTGGSRVKDKAATRPRGSAGAKTAQTSRRAAAERLAEPLPARTAGEHTGRSPAPMGSIGDDPSHDA